VRYLETQAALIGLQTLPKQQSFRQTVAMTGSLTLPASTITFETTPAHNQGQTQQTPQSQIRTKFEAKAGSAMVFGSSNGASEVNFSAPMIFAGYGITAPDETWDDYKDLDVKGKLLVVMVNDPAPTVTEPQRFGGAALTYYGRWMYKYEEAARHGAAGILLIHTTASATYGWNVPETSFSHERFHLAGGGNPLEGWWKEDSARDFLQPQVMI